MITPIAVVGGGFAGLVAADRLREHGANPLVFESGTQSGGLASTKSVGPYKNDIGAHFVTNRLARLIGAASLSRRLRSYSEAVFLDGKWYHYPFGMPTMPGVLGPLLKSQLQRSKRTPENAKEVAVENYGEVFANSVAIPLLEKWSGVAASDLVPEALGALPTSMVRELSLHSLRVATGLPVAVGYCHERAVYPWTLQSYPKSGGISSLLEPLRGRLVDSIRLESPVDRVELENGRVRAVRSNGRMTEVAGAFISSPADIVPTLMPDFALASDFTRLRFRRVIVVNIWLDSERIMPSVVGWFPSTSFRFLRITEVPNAAPWTVPKGITALTVDYAVDGIGQWTDDDSKIINDCVRDLQEIAPQVSTQILNASVTRIKYGYPIFERSTDHIRTQMRASLPKGCAIIGRNGEFSHVLMEDVYWRTRATVDEFMTSRSL